MIAMMPIAIKKKTKSISVDAGGGFEGLTIWLGENDSMSPTTEIITAMKKTTPTTVLLANDHHPIK